MEMSKLMGKCGAGIASAWNGMKRTAGNTKQDGKIADAESEIARMTREIGNLTVLKLDEGLDLGEDVQVMRSLKLCARTWSRIFLLRCSGMTRSAG